MEVKAQARVWHRGFFRRFKVCTHVEKGSALWPLWVGMFGSTSPWIQWGRDPAGAISNLVPGCSTKYTRSLWKHQLIYRKYQKLNKKIKDRTMYRKRSQTTLAGSLRLKSFPCSQFCLGMNKEILGTARLTGSLVKPYSLSPPCRAPPFFSNWNWCKSVDRWFQK